jgi:hypothetical protein
MQIVENRPRGGAVAATNVAELEPRELLTRREVAAYLTAKGYPLTLQHLTNLSMPSKFEGPPVACWWGQHAMHRPAEALAWAKARAEMTTRARAARPQKKRGPKPKARG